jgi:protein required for attachment to host cells
MRMPKTLYLIADGGRVRYVERIGPGHFNTFRKFVSAHIHDKASELVRDRQARVQESATGSRHGVEPRIKPRDKIELKFIQTITADLGKDDTIGDFDNLVIVAPGRLLNALRKSLPARLASKLVESIDKDLTKIPDGELYRHLPVFLASKAATYHSND